MGKVQTAESFWARVDKSGGPDACWEWQGSKQALGYGQVGWKGRVLVAHRLAYTLTHGPIPEGMQVHHKCNNPPCCNPSHLEAVTQKANILLSNGTAAKNARKQHCPRGHPYDDENTYYDTQGGRECRACRRERVKKFAARPRPAENRIW